LFSLEDIFTIGLEQPAAKPGKISCRGFRGITSEARLGDIITE